MGIQISGKNRATSKILSSLCSYMFEQECGELSFFSPKEIETLNEAKRVLSKHLQ